MQNRRMLRFYRSIWACVGLEMEGVYFEAAVNQARVMGLVRPDIITRYVYYTSDLPVSPGTSLAKPMDVSEFIPSLYAISRVYLFRCLDKKRSQPATPHPSLSKLKSVLSAVRAVTRFKILAQSEVTQDKNESS